MMIGGGTIITVLILEISKCCISLCAARSLTYIHTVRRDSRELRNLS